MLRSGLVKKVPLRNLNAAWIPDETPRRPPLGIALDCPTCTIHPHRLELPLHDQAHWQTRPLYRSVGDSMTSISLSPGVVGNAQYHGCVFRGWVDRGHVTYVDSAARPVWRWEND